MKAAQDEQAYYREIIRRARSMRERAAESLKRARESRKRKAQPDGPDTRAPRRTS